MAETDLAPWKLQSPGKEILLYSQARKQPSALFLKEGRSQSIQLETAKHSTGLQSPTQTP